MGAVESVVSSDGPIASLAWEAKGPRLVLGTMTREVFVVDFETRTRLITLAAAFGEKELLNETVHALSWAPDGNKIVGAYSATERPLQVWDAKSGRPLRRIGPSFEGVPRVAWSPKGDVIAFGAVRNRAVVLLDAETGKERARIARQFVGGVSALCWSPDGTHLAILSSSGDIKSHRGATQRCRLLVWNCDQNELARMEDFPRGLGESVAWSQDGKMLAVGLAFGAVIIFDAITGRRVTRLEVADGLLTMLAFSPDSEFLVIRATRPETLTGFGADARAAGLVTCWRTGTWEVLWKHSVSASSYGSAPVAFHPNSRAVVFPDKGDRELQLRFVHAGLISNGSAQAAVKYKTAKLALVGDSGVGKTGLGWRIANGEYREHSSTHGQQCWSLDSMHTTLPDGTECDAVLWDFAGQPDFRLIHTLFLDDIDVAVLVFDPSNRQEPLRGVEYWLAALERAPGEGRVLVLAGARTDRGEASLTSAELEGFCRDKGIASGYVATSALTGKGVDDLVARIRSAIRWDARAPTVTSETFLRVKSRIVRLKAEATRGGSILMNEVELLAHIREQGDWNPDHVAVTSALWHLAKHGYVTRLTGPNGDPFVLLSPELLNNLASSMVLEARRNAKGLGALEETRLLAGGYRFQELEGLGDKARELLSAGAATLFLQRNICYRERLGGESLLVFPSLINLRKPSADEALFVDDVSYTIRGAVENIYASLVVLLGYTNAFTRTDQWQNQAQYEMEAGQTCGFRLAAEREGEIELVTYYRHSVSRPNRRLFQSLLEKFLVGREIEVVRHPKVSCPSCEHIQERAIVSRRIRESKRFLHCEECGMKISLSARGEEVSLSRAEKQRVQAQEVVAEQRTRFEAALVQLKALARQVRGETPARCFVSYAWGNEEHEAWVARLCADLENAGIDILWDRKDNAAVGSSISRFVSKIDEADYVIVVGTPLYREKYENKDPRRGSVVAAEVDLISQRLLASEDRKATVLPALLAGSEDASLPPLLRRRVYADFLTAESYFASVLDLFVSIHKIPQTHQTVLSAKQSLASIA